VLLTISSVGGDGMEMEKTGVVVHDHCTLGHSSGGLQRNFKTSPLVLVLSTTAMCSCTTAPPESSGNQKDTIKTTATKAGSNLLIVC